MDFLTLRILARPSGLACCSCLIFHICVYAQPHDLESMLTSGEPSKVRQARAGFVELLKENTRQQGPKDAAAYYRLSIATCDNLLGQRKAAKAELIRIIADYPGSPFVFLAHREMGFMSQVSWHTKDAEIHLKEALRLAQQLELPAIEIAQIRLSNAINFVVKGQNDQAESEFQEVRKLVIGAETPNTRYVLADCEIQLAELDSRKGHTGASISRLRKVLATLETVHTPESVERQFSCHHYLAKLYRDLTRFDDAQEEIVKAASLLTKNGLLSQSVRMRHLEELEIARAELIVEQALSAFELSPEDTGVLAKLTKAEDAISSAIALHQQITQEETKEIASAHAVLGAIGRIRGRIHEYRNQETHALTSYEMGEREYASGMKVFQTLLDSSNHDVVLEMRRQRAWLAGKLGNTVLALNEAEEILEQLSERYGDESLQVAEVHQLLVSLSAMSGNDKVAFTHTTAHRRIANAYLYPYTATLTSASQHRFFRRWCDPALHDGLRIAADNSDISRSTAEWLINGKARSAEIQGQVTRQARLTGSVKAYMRAVEKQAYVLYGESTEDAESTLLRLESEKRRLLEEQGIDLTFPWISIERIQQSLESQEVLVDLFAVKDEFGMARDYYAWVTKASGDPTAIKLGDAKEINRLTVELLSRLENYTGPYTLQSSNNARVSERVIKDTYLKPLSELLLRPIRDAAGDNTTWIISPDGPLWALPWAALITRDEGYLIEDVTLRYAVSARDLLLREHKQSINGPSMVISDLDYDASTEAVPGKWRDTNEQLERLESEGRQVHEYLASLDEKTAWVSRDSEAKQSVMNMSSAPRVLYLATHGRFLEQSDVRVDDPFLCCYVAMPGYNYIPAPIHTSWSLPGVLTGAEVLKADLGGTELVVLSACQTGIGIDAYGHSAASLRHAFHLSGARSVVASHWSVANEPTKVLLEDFMGRYSRAPTKDKAELLRESQISLINRLRRGYFDENRQIGSENAAHPYYWAAFSLSGD